MTAVQNLIIGQGISGTFLSWYLEKAGQEYLVIDDHDPAASSRVAAGIINPVTGRRIVQTWMIDTLLPFAWNAYREIGEFLGINAITEKTIIDFFPSPQMVLAFQERVAENDPYLSLPADRMQFADYLNADFGFGKISPAYAVNLAALLPAWEKFINEKGRLRQEVFDLAKLELPDNSVRYGDINAQRIFFCNGIAASNYPFFEKLPFALNKGQALVIRVSGLPSEYIFKKGLTLVPLDEEHWWVGSSYEWDFDHSRPDPVFLERSVAQLRNWLRPPFTVEAHLAALRPATLERRPFAGLHPKYTQIGMLNGMGTKGCSLAPYFANQLVEHLVSGSPILPQADLNRFARVLSMR